MPTPLTIIYPCYSQPLMLQYQVALWNQYPHEVQVILVDDGSPEPALSVIEAHATPALLRHLRLYRIREDIAWNRAEARNLGGHEACTDWMACLDLDHVFPVESITPLLAFAPRNDRHYRFHRWRRGKADETRRKDQVPPDAEYAPVGPHMDSYLVHKAVYWQAGGYHEAFAGVLGGGSEFLRRLQAVAPWELAPPAIRVEVVTRSVVPDASVTMLDRDTGPGKMIERQVQGQRPTQWLCIPWARVL